MGLEKAAELVLLFGDGIYWYTNGDFEFWRVLVLPLLVGACACVYRHSRISKLRASRESCFYRNYRFVTVKLFVAL